MKTQIFIKGILFFLQKIKYSFNKNLFSGRVTNPFATMAGSPSKSLADAKGTVSRAPNNASPIRKTLYASPIVKILYASPIIKTSCVFLLFCNNKGRSPLAIPKLVSGPKAAFAFFN